MGEIHIQELLKISGTRRTAKGVEIPLEDGWFCHVFNTFDRNDYEGITEEELLFAACCSKSEIMRLRKLRTAHDYLLRLRATAIADDSRAARVFLQRRQAFEKSTRRWSLSQYYHRKDGYQKSYLNRLPRSASEKLRGVPSGLAWLTAANAICKRSMLGDIVVVSEGLEHFFYFMNLGFYGDKWGLSPDDRTDAFIIALRIMRETEASDFDIDPRGELPSEIEREVWESVSWQMQFTFGHEFAHKICGHLESAESTELLRYGPELEFEADAAAIDTISQIGPAFLKLRNGALSALLFLVFLNSAQRQLASGSLPISTSHPDPDDRARHLFANLGKNKPYSEAVLENQLTTASNFANLVLDSAVQGSNDILDFYGSVYLRSFTKRVRVDRFEF